MTDALGLGLMLVGGVLIWIAWKSQGSDPVQMFNWFYQEISNSASESKGSTSNSSQTSTT